MQVRLGISTWELLMGTDKRRFLRKKVVGASIAGLAVCLVAYLNFITFLWWPTSSVQGQGPLRLTVSRSGDGLSDLHVSLWNPTSKGFLVALPTWHYSVWTEGPLGYPSHYLPAGNQVNAVESPGNLAGQLPPHGHLECSIPLNDGWDIARAKPGIYTFRAVYSTEEINQMHDQPRPRLDDILAYSKYYRVLILDGKLYSVAFEG